jgi:S-adenosylmethionine decarboxylase
VTGGTEWLVDAFACDPTRLRDAPRQVELADRLIALLGLAVIGSPLVHVFGGPGGVTGLYLLSESHFAWHTYPESGLATYNLYCCRACAPLSWAALLSEALGARDVEVTTLMRGLRGAAEHLAAPAGVPPQSARPGTRQ